MSCFRLISRLLSTNEVGLVSTHVAYTYRPPILRTKNIDLLMTKPSFDQTQKFLKSHTLGTSPKLKSEEIGNCGIGLSLYFLSLKFWGLFFGLLTALSIGPMAINYSGEYYENDGRTGSIETLTLGSVAGLPVRKITIDEGNQILAGQRYVKLSLVLFDVVGVLLFLIAYIWYRGLTKSYIKSYRNRFPSLPDYALELNNVPETHIMDLALFFESTQWKIVEIVPIRRFPALKLSLYLSELDQLKEILLKQVRRNRIDWIKRRLRKINTAQEEAKDKMDQLNKRNISPGQAVYVVFRYREDKDACLQLFQQSWIKRCRAAFQKRSNATFLDVVRANTAPIPDDIYWEHVYEPKTRFHLLYFPLAIVFFLVTACLIYGLKQSMLHFPDADECFLHIQNDKDAWYDFCECRSNASVSECYDYTLKIAITYPIQLATGLVIAVLNACIPTLLRCILVREQQVSAPDWKREMMLKTFGMLVINSSFLVLLVNANFQISPFFDGSYSDLSRGWYAQVGFSLFITMALGVITPHWLFVSWSIVKRSLRSLAERTCKTQLELNNWTIGPSFDLPVKTSLALLSIFGCVIYSGGIPLLNAVCACTLLGMYVVERRLLLRQYQCPTEHSEVLHTWFLRLLPFCVVIHCGMSLWMYGAYDIFPSEFQYQNPTHVTGAMTKFYALPVVQEYGTRIWSLTGLTFLILIVCTCIISFCDRIDPPLFSATRIPLSEQQLIGSPSYRLDAAPIYRKALLDILDLSEEEDIVLDSFSDLDSQMDSPLHR